MPSLNPRHTSRHGGYLDPRDRLVYSLFDADGVLLYVGCTVDLKSRLRAHRYRKPWFSDVDRVSVRTCTGGGFDGLVLERQLIQEGRPLYNKVWNADPSPTERESA